MSKTNDTKRGQMPLFLLFLKKEGKRRGKIYKEKSQLSVLLIIGLIFGGMDGTNQMKQQAIILISFISIINYVNN